MLLLHSEHVPLQDLEGNKEQIHLCFVEGTYLMKMWSLNVMILLLFCYASLSTGKGNVFFESKNFFNVLHWDPVEPGFPGEDVLYSVKLQRYGEEQGEIKQCQNISGFTCDLTDQTPLILDVEYVAEVLGNGTSLGYTTRFKPLADTAFGPPTLWKRTSRSALLLNVTLPLGPHEDSIADIIARGTTGSSKTVFLYTLHLTHPKWAEHVNESTSGQFVINLKKQTEYCGYVVYRPSPEWGRKESEKAHFCETIPGDHQVHWILVGAAVVAGLVVTAIVCVCTYVKGGNVKSTPRALDFQKAPEIRLQCPDENFIFPKLKDVSEKEACPTIKMQVAVPPKTSQGYFAQDNRQDSTGSSVDTGASSVMPNPEITSAQSSDIYGVVVVHVPQDENGYFPKAANEDTQIVRDSGKMRGAQISRGSPALPDVGSAESDEARPLVLRTSRDVDGQLVLSSFALRFPDINDDTGSPVSPEMKPLLKDLIDSKDEPSLDTSEWSDSGCDEGNLNSPAQPYCNSNYSPTQPVSGYLQQGTQSRLPEETTSEAAYKPNWMYKIGDDCASTERCEDTKTDYQWTSAGLKMEDEGENDEGNDGVESSFTLGKWMIHIQD